MTFEAMQSLSPGRSVKGTLYPAQNRVEIETAGTVSADEIDAALPPLLALLADRSRLPVRHGGKVYTPRPLPVRPEWGER